MSESNRERLKRTELVLEESKDHSFHACNEDCIGECGYDYIPVCEKHRKISAFPISYHYYICSYCILEDTLYTYKEKCKIRGSWIEEYDSWEEVTSRSLDIIVLGYFDFKRNVSFLDGYKPGKKPTEDTLHFRRLYYIGQQLAADGVPETTIKLFV